MRLPRIEEAKPHFAILYYIYHVLMEAPNAMILNTQIFEVQIMGCF